MITKLFEFVNYKPKLGNYVIVSLPENINKKFEAIGIITNINDASYPYTIDFEFLSGERYVDTFKFDELKCWSDNKEELEQILVNNKFNL